MLAEIQVNKTDRKVFALDEYGKVFAAFNCGTSFFRGLNEYGQPRGNAENGVYRDGNVWCECKGPAEADEPPYGWAYINIDNRGRAIHGGGSNCEDPFEPFQPLLPTYGCFRMHNAEIYLLALWFNESMRQGLKPCVHVVGGGDE